MRIWNRETTSTPIIAFGCNIDADILLVYETHVESRREIRCDTHNSIGNVDVVFERQGSEYMKIQASIAVNQDIYMNSTTGILTSNISNTFSNDLSFYATLTNNMMFYANAAEKINIT